MITRWFVGCGLVLGLIAGGCGSDSAATGGTGGARGPDFEPPEFGSWVKYEPEGATCSDGSPYKFWVEFSETSDNVILFFEGGGACWDYESCSGGARGAANPNGLRDDYAEAHAEISGLTINVNQVYPLLNGDPDVSPMADWNKVFVPYCTGDIYGGTRTAIYANPNEGEEDLEFRHVGHLNILKMTEMLDEMFSDVPKMFVGGCSAGGIGALVNYYFLRTGISGVQKGYLLDDSGPAFPSKEPTSRSLPLYEKIRPSWDVDSVIDTAPQSDRLRADFGQLAGILADEFPEDRLASTFFRMDYNFSLYSYERFYTLDLDNEDIVLYTGDGLGLSQHNSLHRAAVHSLFWDDVPLFRTLADSKNNLGYYIPFYRDTNSSHCVTVPGFEDVSIPEALNLFQNDFGTLAWLGSEIADMNLRDYVDHLLNDDEPLQSHFEQEGEGHYLSCSPAAYDEADCKTAVCERLDDARQLEQGCPPQ